MKLSLTTLPIKKEVVIQIQCSMDENTLPASLPSRNWHAQSKTWRVPIVRLNIEYLRRNKSLYEASDDYWAMLNEFGKEKDRKTVWSSDYPFKLAPFPHQRDCCKRLYPIRNHFIAADIGTGKTKMAIDIASHRYYDGVIGKVLVIALVSIKDNWINEIDMHCPVPSTAHKLETTVAGKKRFKKFLEEDGFRWLVLGIESLSAGKAFDLCKEFVDKDTMIIIDESDSIKSHKASRTDRCIELGNIASFKTAMTGTPITQGIIDLFSQFEFIDPNVIGIGDFYSFRNRYAVMGGFDKRNIIGYQRVEELTTAMVPYTFQVRKREVLTDLPPATYQERKVEMSPEQKKLYKELKSTLKLEYNGNKLTVASTINLMQRFTEISDGYYSYVDEKEMGKIEITEKVKIKYKKEYLKTNPKAKELMELVRTMADDESIIIWATSKMAVAYLLKTFSDIYGEDQVVPMHGGISEEDRTAGLKRFQSGRARFLIGNQAVGGIGLNMTRAAVMIYFSNDFSLRRRIQSEGRIERIGQTRPMTYIDMLCSPIDRYILKALRGKLDFAEVIRAAFDNNELEGLT